MGRVSSFPAVCKEFVVAAACVEAVKKDKKRLRETTEKRA
jgi:hypothetical protein